jgi:site-specific recombinase XerD
MKNKELFRRFLIVEKGLQEITAHGYVGSAERFTWVLGESPNHEGIKNYMYILYTSEYSYSHKMNTALAVEKYMEFLGKPIQLGRQKKPKPMIKDTLTEAEVTKLIFNTKNIREKAIVSLLAYSGIRNLELCNLKVRDFLYTQNAIRIIKGKGIKDGVSEITPECSKILMQYIQEYNKKDDDMLFSTLRKGNLYRPQDTRKLIHVVAKRANIQKRVYPHLLRHSMSANMLLRGVNIVSLKNQLRHTLLETTLHYVNSIVFIDKNQYQKFAPSYI